MAGRIATELLNKIDKYKIESISNAQVGGVQLLQFITPHVQNHVGTWGRVWTPSKGNTITSSGLDRPSIVRFIKLLSDRLPSTTSFPGPLPIATENEHYLRWNLSTLSRGRRRSCDSPRRV